MIPLTATLVTVASMVIGFCAGIVSIGITDLLRKRYRGALGGERGFWFGLLSALLTAFAGLTLARRVFDSTPSALTRVTLGTTALAVVAAALFWVKARSLRTYAIVELVFALIVAGKTMFDLQDFVTPLQAVSLMASVYLMVRGAENLKLSRQLLRLAKPDSQTISHETPRDTPV